MIRTKQARKTAPQFPEATIVALDTAVKRLQRASGVLTAITFIAEEGADIDLAPVAICARDVIDRAIEGLASMLKQGGTRE